MPDLFLQLLARCKTLALPLQDLGTAPAATVQRDARGLPVAWRLFPFGPISITQNGQTATGQFTPEMADTILAFAAEKGVPVPIDAEHALFALAQHMGVEESALAGALPSGSLAVGFGTLEKRADGLWLSAVDWTDVGRALLQGGAYRYYSPVLRGNSDGRYRITSTSLTNNPAINRLDAIAAEADDTMARDTVCLADLTRAINPPKRKEQPMQDLLARLGAILGTEAIALAADGAVPATVTAALDKLGAELPTLREHKAKADAFLAAVKAPLALSGEADLSAVQGAILGLAEKARTADDLKARVDALALESETRKIADLTKQGLEAGKLTKAMVATDWFKGQDSVALSAFLAVAPKVVPVGGAVDPATLATDDAAALTDEDRKACVALGLPEAEFLKTKQGK